MDIVSPLPEAMRFALDFSGPDRLLFSSDHPWVNLKRSLNRLAASSHVPLPQSRQHLLGYLPAHRHPFS